MVKVETRVLVAGASIAGPALAHWLRRRGAGVTVVERAPGLRPGGQAVDARGVTREVIRRMGLDAAVRAARNETAGAYTVDVDGKVLETYRADDDGGDGYIAEIEILRGDLSRVLHDDTRDGVEYIFGDRIAGLTQDADGVRRGLRGRRPAALRPRGRGGRAALGAAHDGLRAARAVRPPPRARDGLLHCAERVRAGPLADRLPGIRVRALRRPAAHPGRHPGDGHVLLSRGRPSTSTTAMSRPRSACCASGWPAWAGWPRASSRTWTTPRTSTWTRLPRW